MDCSAPGFSVLPYLLEFTQTHVHWVGDTIQPSHLLLPPSPPALILSKYQGLFQEAEALQIRWPKYWNFSSSTSRSSDYSGFISFRIDYSDLVVQGALKSLQHHSSKASIVQHSAFFMVQLSHPCMITGKTLGTFVHKVKSLLFNNLSRFVIAFLPRRNCLLISWL